MEGEDDLLEGRGVVVAHEIVDQALVLTVALRPLAVADAGALDDPLVAAKIVDEADEALVQNREALVEDPLGLLYDAM